MSRVIRSEDPSVSFTLLDVESATNPDSVGAIRDMIFSLHADQSAQQTTRDYEFVERNGIGISAGFTRIFS
jgi:hypothetical protein